MKISSVLSDTARVARIRQRILDAPQQVCVERARYMTQAMETHWDAHPLTRISLGLANVLNNIQVIIREDELVVGCRTSKLKGVPLFPENKSRWIEGDVDNFDKRQIQRALISEAEKEELKTKILGNVQNSVSRFRFPDLPQRQRK
ncbi:MAG: hypothetical protein HUK40_03490 [Desulfobacter sp.]|nr:hypothetical protein [Desulfobacter sp.]